MIKLTNKEVNKHITGGRPKVTPDYSTATILVPKDIAKKLKGVYKVSTLSQSIKMAIDDLLILIELNGNKHPAILIDRDSQNKLYSEPDIQKIA